MRFTSIHVALGATLAFIVVEPARASLNDHLNEHISAAACRVVNSDDRSLLQFDTANNAGDWIFAPGVEDEEVLLECPIYTRFTDEDTGIRSLSELRLWYQDTDGAGDLAFVSAELLLRRPTGVLISKGSVHSNNSNSMARTTLSLSLGGAAMEDAQYFVQVTLFRSTTGHNARFRGLSFFTKP